MQVVKQGESDDNYKAIRPVWFLRDRMLSCPVKLGPRSPPFISSPCSTVSLHTACWVTLALCGAT